MIRLDSRRCAVAHVIALAFLAGLGSGSAVAQGQVLESGFGFLQAPASDHLSDAQRAEIQAEIDANVERLDMEGRLPVMAARGGGYGWPLRAADGYTHPGYHGISNFVDHDQAFPGHLRDYMCGSRTYDLASGYNHAGIDFFTWPFGWYMMDHDLVEVVAIADGVIVAKHDGHYDRNCSMTGGMWNAVYVRHADGAIAWYGHLKKDSLTPKQVGEAVVAGEYLGVVGSSGNSTGPHLHLELYDADGQLVDPYAGECNLTIESSLWAEQRPYFDSALNAVLTHSAPPGFPACPQQEIVNLKDQFEPGESVYLAVYLRDQRAGQPGQITLRRPDGSVLFEGDFQLSQPHFAASYWYWHLSNTSSLPQGTWTWEATFEGSTVAHSFAIGQATSSESGAPALVDLSGPYPNPSFGGARLTLTTASPQRVRAVLYDVLGRQVEVLFDGETIGGEDVIEVTGRGLSAGVYTVRVEGDGFVAHRRITLVD